MRIAKQSPGVVRPTGEIHAHMRVTPSRLANRVGLGFGSVLVGLPGLSVTCDSDKCTCDDGKGDTCDGILKSCRDRGADATRCSIDLNTGRRACDCYFG